jgi:hypothetical protein
MNSDPTIARFNALEIGDAPQKPAQPQTPNANAFTAVNSLQVGKDSKATRRADGTWVNSIGLESTEEHRHVSKIWQDQCVSLETVYGQVQADAQHKRDRLVPESAVRLDSQLRLPDGTPLTANGVETLRTFTDLKSTTIANLMELEHTGMVATLLNSELDKREIEWASKRKSNRDFRVRLRHNAEGQDVARAVVSGRYGVIDNLHALEMIIDALPTKDAVKHALMSHAFDDGDDMYGNILLPDYVKSEPDSDYGVGIAFRNSEIRNATFRIDPFLFRAICLNGNIWSRLNSEIKINQKHLGKIDFAELRAEVRRAVHVALTHGNDLLTQLGYTREVELETPVETIIANLSRANRLTIEQGKEWHRGYVDSLQEPTGHVHENTAFGIVNGLTRAAQQFKGETRTQMEMVAGIITTPSLDAPLSEVMRYWSNIEEASRRLDEDTVKQYVYVTA